MACPRHDAPDHGQVFLAMFLWAICFPPITRGIADAPHPTFARWRAALTGLDLVGIALAGVAIVPQIGIARP